MQLPVPLVSTVPRMHRESSTLSYVAARGLFSLGSFFTLLLNLIALTQLHLPCLQIHSPGEFQDVLHMNPGSLVVLMCKAQVCWEGTGLLHKPGEPGGAGVQCTGGLGRRCIAAWTWEVRPCWCARHRLAGQVSK